MTFATLTQKITFVAGAIAAAGFVAAAPAHALSFGDVQITGYQSTNPDSFSFVTWVDLVNGTDLTFTDNGFTGTAWRTTENVTNWSNTTGSTISAGTVINITGNPNATGTDIGPGADLGTGLPPGLSAGGDQIFIIEGKYGAAAPVAPNTTPALFTGTSGINATINGNLLFGFDYSGAAGWSDAGNSNTSALPSVLNATDRNFAFAVGSPTSPGIQYSGVRTGLTIAQYKALLADVSNWTPYASGASSSTDFSIANNAIPTPALLPGLVGLGLSVLRKHKAEVA
jgi:hypothetical protein